LPIYEYRCEACGHTFEVMQKFTDTAIEACEVCGGHVVRVFHPVAIHFRGSGFYTTDYGRSSKAARAGRDEGDGKAASESKPSEGRESKEGKEGGPKSDTKGGAGAKEAGSAGAAAKTGTG
jgi:putative FmdB family regulatory protein